MDQQTRLKAGVLLLVIVLGTVIVSKRTRNRPTAQGPTGAVAQSLVVEQETSDKTTNQEFNEKNEPVSNVVPKEAVPELLTNYGLNAADLPKEGDVQGIKNLYREKYDLEIEDLHRNANETYKMTVSGRVSKEAVPAYQLIKNNQNAQYKQALLQELNHGRNVSITAKDLREIDEFRKAWNR